MVAGGTAAMLLITAFIKGVRNMKTILSALIALSLVASVTAPANAAWDAKTFWDELARSAT
jgi:hypothetical protein